MKYILRAFNRQGHRMKYEESQSYARLRRLVDDLIEIDPRLVITIELGDRLVLLDADGIHVEVNELTEE